MTDLFIVAQHRTGSTLLKNMLDAHPAVCMAFDEMNLFEPLRDNSLDRLMEKGTCSAQAVVDAVYAGQVYGTFWQKFPESGIQREALLTALKEEPELSPDAVIRQVLKLLRSHGEVSHAGVKYPVHVSRLSWLLQHFPGSHVIFLIRNPMAVVASKVNDEATRARKQKSVVHRFGVHYFTLLYFCLEFRQACRVYERYRGNVLKIHYESLVQAPEETLRNICKHLGIEFHTAMLSVTGKSSSHTSQAYLAPVSESVDRYRHRLTRFDQWLIDLLTRRSYRKVK